jgi:hypothetical protein
VVARVLTDGQPWVHYRGHKRAYALVDRDEFTPSKSAYWSEGSYVEPEWDNDSARCLNYWVDEVKA